MSVPAALAAAALQAGAGIYASNQASNAQWKALPNYIEGESNILVMADTSGSMQGRPMATSVGLAMYFAERNHRQLYR